MRTTRVLLRLGLLAALTQGGCQQYTSVHRDGSTVFLTGSTTFLIFTATWVKECRKIGTKLNCRRLNVEDSGFTADSDDPAPHRRTRERATVLPRSAPPPPKTSPPEPSPAQPAQSVERRTVTTPPPRERLRPVDTRMLGDHVGHYVLVVLDSGTIYAGTLRGFNGIQLVVETDEGPQSAYVHEVKRVEGESPTP